jgi:hypothetical protein
VKQKILKITPEEIIRALQGNLNQKLYLPVDTELLGIKYDVFTKQVIAVLRSDTFEDVPEGTSIPEFTCKSSASALPQQSQTTIVPATNMSVNALDEVSTEDSGNQISPVVQQKSLIQTLTVNSSSSSTNIGTGVKTLGSKPESNMDTCGFEDEFTKEQRKVLRFTSVDDFVIVKPIQFLKTEWEDINDIVKSIGGKWVKGGTIDYWAIPKNIRQEE